MNKAYTSFVHTTSGSIRYISGMTAYDEKMIGGRLVARYLNACGQILPEMHLHDTLFYGEDENVFALTVEGKELSNGWRMEKVEVQEDRASVTLLHESCPVRVEVTTRGDGQDWLTRELMVQNLSDRYLPIDSVVPLCGKLWRHRFDNGILSYTPEECGSANDRIFEVGYAPLCSWGKEGDYGFHPLRKALRYNGGMNGRSGWSRPSYVLKNNLQDQIDVRHIDVTRPGVCPGLATNLDIIAASELLYLDELHGPILNFLERHLADQGQAVFCTDVARRKPHFAKKAAKRFTVSEVFLPGSFSNKDGEPQKRIYSLLTLQKQV